MRFWDEIKYKDNVFRPIDVFWVPYKSDNKGRIIENAKWKNPFELYTHKNFSELCFEDFMRKICENKLLIARYYDEEKEEVYLFPLKKDGIMPKELFSENNCIFYAKKKVE